MISYKEAIEILSQSFQALPIIRVNAEQAYGVLAEDLISEVQVPSFSNSAMDGFAVKSEETQSASKKDLVKLEVKGCVLAGEIAPVIEEKKSSCEIMTGSIMPEGFNAVIPIEQVIIEETLEGKFITINQVVNKGRNVRLAGEDYKPGTIIAKKGQVINPHRLMGIIASKQENIPIYQIPKVGVVTTGSELIDQEKHSDKPTIPNTNGPFLQSSIRRMGIHCTGVASTPDSLELIKKNIQHCIDNESDIILTSGGVSAGKLDLVPDALLSLGADILFHKIWMRPGKPLLFARMSSGQFVFGLPGNPVAVAVGFRFFVAQAIRMLQGQALEQPFMATNTVEFNKPEKFCFFAKARTEYTKNNLPQTTFLPGQESFKLSPFRDANSWMILPEGKNLIKVGDKIQVVPLHPGEAL